MINYDLIPVHCLSSVREYIEHGTTLSGFLKEVFANDLVGAFSRADEINRDAMEAYAQFLYSEAPGNCWGSKAIVQAWRGLHSTPKE